MIWIPHRFCKQACGMTEVERFRKLGFPSEGNDERFWDEYDNVNVIPEKSGIHALRMIFARR
jgi:hypothetical protein